MTNNREMRREKHIRIHELKRLLRSTDYIAIKFAEGEITTSEYAPTREQRRAWRSEINALETEIASLGG